MSAEAFKTELENQVKNMNVSMDNVNLFLSNKKHDNLKHTTIKGKDLCGGVFVAKKTEKAMMKTCLQTRMMMET